MNAPFLALSKKLKSPEQVQAWVKKLPYNSEKNVETCRSALSAYRAKTAHCIEGAFLGAAIMEHHGYPPLLLDLESIDHLDHALFIFKTKTGWGSITRSRMIGLHGREPRFRSVRDLAYSYYDPFVDLTGKLVRFSVANLDDTKIDWRYSKRNVWAVVRYLEAMKHTRFIENKNRFKQLKENFLKHGEIRSGKYWW